MTTRDKLHDSIRRTEDLRRRRKNAIAHLTSQWDRDNDFTERDETNRAEIKDLVMQHSGETGRMINMVLVDYPKP